MSYQEICNGRINMLGFCDKCGHQGSQTTSGYCGRLVTVIPASSGTLADKMQNLEPEFQQIVEKNWDKLTEPKEPVEQEQKFKKVDSVTIGEIDEVLKRRSESRINQITIMKNIAIPEGSPILMMHPNDYDAYEKTLKTTK